MAAYRDNPFDSRNNSHADLQDYYDSVPPAHRLSGNNIPLTPAGAQQTPYQQLNVPRNDPFSADSTDDLTTPTAPNRSFADSYANTGPGAAMMSERGRYADESSAPASFVSREPRLGVYGRRDENGDWVQPQRQKSNRRKWVVRQNLTFQSLVQKLINVTRSWVWV
ncbi:hypothetical protein BJ165DRAFT_1039286 [Panaeolus papilionaceus]|nr:hypothetical protein BJ165DRAFT_1039286 [Panaeolus papilionaceus]